MAKFSSGLKLFRGHAAVWSPDFEPLPAYQQDFVRAAARSIHEEHEVFDFMGRRIMLTGIMLGSKLGRDVEVAREIEGVGFPIFGARAIAAEGRLQGLQAEFGMVSNKGVDRMWLVSFGHIQLDQWAALLGIKGFLSRTCGILQVSSAENAEADRRELLERQNKRRG